MFYNEAIYNLIPRLQKEFNKPVRLICSVEVEGIKIEAKKNNKWIEILKYDMVSDPTALDIENFIQEAKDEYKSYE